MRRKGARLSNLRKTIDNHKKFSGKVNDCSDTDFVRTEQKTLTLVLRRKSMRPVLRRNLVQHQATYFSSWYS